MSSIWHHAVSAHTWHLWQINPALSPGLHTALVWVTASFLGQEEWVLAPAWPVSRWMCSSKKWEENKEVSKVCVQFLTKVEKIVWAVNWDSNKILSIQFINPFSISGIVAPQTKRPFKSLFYVVEIYSSARSRLGGLSWGFSVFVKNYSL